MSIINGSSAFSDPRVLPSFLCNLQTYNYALFLIIFFVFAIYSVFVSQLRSIPGPLISHVTPLYRVWILWSGDCASKFQALHQRYGPVVRTGPDCVVISENAAVAKIYGRGWRFPKSQFYRLFALTQHSVMRDTVFSTRSRNEHEVLASHVAGRFSSPLNLAASESMIDKCVALFVAKMRDAGGQTIDLGTWLKYWAFDTNSGFCFGSPVGLIAAGEDLNGMIAHTETGFRIGALVGQVPRCNRFFLGNKAVMRLLKRVGVEDLTTFLVKYAEQKVFENDKSKEEVRQTSLLTWLREERENGHKTMSEDDIIIHLTNSFVAGSITVATSIGATLYFAMRDPRVYMKLVAEVRNLEQSVTADYAETIRMPYLQACIKEAMRLAPTNNLPLERLAPQEGIEVSGHFLPHGTNVGCSAFILHRDCSVYGPDIDTFRPERWIEGDPVAISRMQKHFFAFGRGERGCSGRTLAMMMMGKFIVQILRAMDVEWAGHPTGWNLKAWWMPEQRNYFVKFRSRSS